MHFSSQKSHHVIIMWPCVIPLSNEEVNLLIVADSSHLKGKERMFCCCFSFSQFPCNVYIDWLFFFFFLKNCDLFDICSLTKKSRSGKSGFHQQLPIEWNIIAQTSSLCSCPHICSKTLRGGKRTTFLSLQFSGGSDSLRGAAANTTYTRWFKMNTFLATNATTKHSTHFMSKFCKCSGHSDRATAPLEPKRNKLTSELTCIRHQLADRRLWCLCLEEDRPVAKTTPTIYTKL